MVTVNSSFLFLDPFNVKYRQYQLLIFDQNILYKDNCEKYVASFPFFVTNQLKTYANNKITSIVNGTLFRRLIGI